MITVADVGTSQFDPAVGGGPRRRWRGARRGRRLAVSVLAAMVAVPLAACGDDGGAGATPVTELTVEGAWARPTPPGATAGVVYLSVISPAADELRGASVPAEVATGAGLHETTMDGDGTAMGEMSGMDHGDEPMATMAALDAVPLPAQGRVVFEPGGRHIMLEGLLAPLERDGSFPLTLSFRDHEPLTVEVVVGDGPPDPQR